MSLRIISRPPFALSILPCGCLVKCSYVMFPTFSSFFRRIEDAYQQANSTLLKLLLEQQNIVDRLRSLKHYFFFSQSDFLLTFLEQAERELKKRIQPHKTRETTHLRLQTHLGMVLASSSSAPYDDLYKEDIKIDISEGTVYEELKRINETRGDIEAAKAFAAELKGKEKEKRKEEEREKTTVHGIQVSHHFPSELFEFGEFY